MKLSVTVLLATIALSSASVLKPDNAIFNLDAVSRRHWVQDLGVRGCSYTNQVRAQYGRSQLYYSASLTNIGARHSGWMAYYSIFQHQNLKGVGALVERQWLPVTAENIATSVPRSNNTAWDAHQQWYYSRGHFLNMVNPHHTHCGVGFAYDRYGHWWGTQLFGQNRYIGHEYDPGIAAGSHPPPAFAPVSGRASAPAPAPLSGSSLRWRQSPKPSTNEKRLEERLHTAFVGKPLSVRNISEPAT